MESRACRFGDAIPHARVRMRTEAQRSARVAGRAEPRYTLAMVEPAPGDASDAIAEKIVRLRAIVRGSGSALVAFSGGADSALVLKVAVDELGAGARGLTAVSPTMARRER